MFRKFVKKSTVFFGVFIVVMALSALTTTRVRAAPIDSFPITVTQPDGTVLNLFVSGDEYYNWLHDAQGYTVIQDPDSGYYVYADIANGQLVPTDIVVGDADPALAGLLPHINISAEQMSEIRQASLNLTAQATGGIRHNAPHTGTINNLVVFIRFSDESEFTDATSTYTNLFNNATAGANSLRNYYREVSYNTLTINSTFLPTPGSTVFSYQDGHPRGYYQPYNAVTNPGGYPEDDGGAEAAFREHTLLSDAVIHINSLGQFPSGASIDADGDGIVDSITFIVSGSPTGFSTLLWPHQWTLFTYTVTINGKLVDNYAFQLNSALDNGVLAHEMFHVLGAPDLYHLSGDGQPTGAWDIMEVDYLATPQHMGCYMKFKYGNWISSIPELTALGTYTLNPITSPTNNCYKIKSPNSTTEYFVVEYRRATGPFEGSLPGTGLLVYRINTLEYGNFFGPPDEVYVYRPGGTTSLDGDVNSANFSFDVGRTTINDSTDPSSFLSSGSAGGLKICNIGASTATISFDVFCPAPDSYEPDNTSGQAKTINSGIPQAHNITPVTDEDWVKFTLSGSSAVLLETTGGLTSSDTRMWLYNSGLTEVEFSDDEGIGNYSFIDKVCGVDPLPAGTYYVKVDDYDNDNVVPSYNISFSAKTCPAASVNVSIAGERQGSYLLAAGQSQKVTYNLDAGPVKVESTSGMPIVAALRDGLLVNGSLSTFSQLMGLPNEQLSDTYWFPTYVNNSTLNGQLRFANVGVADTTVTVTIGGVIRGSYLLHPNEMKKETYALDAGPVKVQSSGGVPIVAALRDALVVNGSLSTFSQLMGIPDEQLSDTYWFPAYVNNSTLNGQLRFANVGVADTTVTVTIGGVNRGSYLLHPNEMRKETYALDAGPVKVQSSGGVPIVAALRDALLVNGSLSTFSQLMGLPDEGLSDTYWIPAYVNNSTLNGQLRFGNVGVADTTVTVTIGGVNRGSYLLHPNENKKVDYALDAGPVKITSTGSVPIVAALRDALLVNGSLSTFSQLMGLPDEQLSTIYWLPTYVNNSVLNGQLRFGVP